jgi:hypothetical protein
MPRFSKAWAIRARALRWPLTIACCVVLGLVAARFRLLDSPIVVVALGVVVALIIAYGVRTTMQPWDGWDD